VLPPFLLVQLSSPQRFIKSAPLPRPQGTKALEKGGLACNVQPTLNAQEQEQAQPAASWRQAQAAAGAAGCGDAAPMSKLRGDHIIKLTRFAC
jgi:hypothetical protein